MAIFRSSLPRNSVLANALSDTASSEIRACLCLHCRANFQLVVAFEEVRVRWALDEPLVLQTGRAGPRGH